MHQEAATASCFQSGVLIFLLGKGESAGATEGKTSALCPQAVRRFTDRSLKYVAQ